MRAPLHIKRIECNGRIRKTDGSPDFNHLAAVGGPLPGLAQGQRDMMIVAAFAAAYAGKVSIHKSARHKERTAPT